MHNHTLRKEVLAFILVGLIAFEAIPIIEARSNEMQQLRESEPAQEVQESQFDWVYVMYDPSSINMTYLAENVFEILSRRIYKLALIPINSEKDLEQKITGHPWMVIYAFETNLTGIFIGDQNVQWRDFYGILMWHPETKHILGVSNTFSFAEIMPPNAQSAIPAEKFIFLSQAEQIDLNLLLLYDIWTVSEIALQRAENEPAYNDTATDLRLIATKIYADNFNFFFQVNMQPQQPIGQVNETAREIRRQEMLARHAPTLRPAYYQKEADGSLTEIPAEEIDESFQPLIKLGPKPEPGSGDFDLGEIPLFSALQGPIGDIIDVLLLLLSDEGENTLSIPSDLMETIQGIFGQIADIVGLVSNFDLESPLKSLLDLLANEFPFFEDLKPFLEIFVKVLFNLRGGIDDISSVIFELVDAVITTVLPEEVGDIISSVLDIGGDLWNELEAVVSDGKSIFDAMVSFFTSNLMETLLNKTLVATIGITQGQATSFVSRFVPYIKSVTGFLVDFDIDKLVEMISGPIIEAVTGTLSTLESTGFKQIGKMVKLGLSVADLVDEFDTESIIDILKELLNEFVGPTNFVMDVETLTRNIMNVVKDYKEGGFSTIDTFKTRIEQILQGNVSGAVTPQMRSLITDIITMITGLYNDGFDPAQLPDIFELAGTTLDLLGLDTPSLTEMQEALNGLVKPFLAIIGQLTQSAGLLQLLPTELKDFSSIMDALPSLLESAIEYMDVDSLISGLPDFHSIISTFGQITGGLLGVVENARGKSFTGVLQAIWTAIGGIVGIHPSFDDVPLDAMLKLFECFFPEAFGFSLDNAPNPQTVVQTVLDLASPLLTGVIDPTILEDFLTFAMDIKGLFTDGMDWIVGKILDWLTGLLDPILNDLEDAIMSVFSDGTELLGFHDTIGIGLGDWSLFTLSIDLGIQANFNIDPRPLFDMVKSLILDGSSAIKLDSVGDFFEIFFSMFEISPQFYAELGVGGLDTESNPFMKFLLTALGLDLSFSGYARFVLNLFTFRGGVFEWDNFFEVVEWGFGIKIELSKTFTLLDFLTGGLGGGALNAVMEFLGLDTIKVIIFIGVQLDIVKKAATATGPEVSSLTITITLGVTIRIPLDLFIVAIILEGTLEIILTFYQDFSSGDPMKITLRLIITFRVELRFLFITADFSWTWEPGGPWDLSPKKGDDEYNNSGVGFDSDNDGLGDDYEAKMPGANPNLADSDSDGASDKLEIQVMGTGVANADSDGDGLLDGEEFELGTNPMRVDSDWDKISDYEEVRIYNTDPLLMDTDGDKLTDSYEIYTVWDIANVTPTVTEVMIGGKSYNDHTDPLNPDTDGDGLLDGEEGPMGPYYGLPALYNESVSDPNPLIFYNGFTHPLDYDTDDDSDYQLYNGAVDWQLNNHFLKDMNDGAEVRGFDIIVYDSEGEPEWKHVFTNPCNPDTDGDTGVTDRTPVPGAWLNSDGYELAQTPPTDPTDGDSDDDGLLDGLEGVLAQFSNHTNPLDPDTDDDGLYDMHEILLGTDPRCADTDLDMIPDGHEFYIYHTSPYLYDTDFDGLSDGEEVYFWHSNPLSDDSDGDRLYDGTEVLRYGSDPMDEDGDDDGVSDYDEILVYGTDPFIYDCDDDGLSDGEELFVYNTDPLKWDTDMDSITQPNEFGEMTWPMSDYDEVMIYGTNPTKPDTDLDGLHDGIELYLSADIIPWVNVSFYLNPLSNDTDGDGFMDGSELLLVNVSHIIYPYTAFTFTFPLNTNPSLADTDGDLLNDYEEVVIYNTDPTINDTDNDTISDYNEVMIYGTLPTTNDTDGDGLWDAEELLVPLGSSAQAAGPHAAALYNTDPLNPDSDGDMLPDGAEVHLYDTDPLDPDSSDLIPDGIVDGLEFDTDVDGLQDGLEYVVGTPKTPWGGGIYNPDSDYDGLLDGDEYYIFGTDPTSPNSDGDIYSDGIEIIIGTDPLVNTTAEQFNEALLLFHGSFTLIILTPKSDAQVFQTTPVQVLNLTNIEMMWCRYRENSGTIWSENISLSYDTETQLYRNSSIITWDTGPTELEVFAEDSNGTQYKAYSQFTVLKVNETIPIVETISPWIIGGSAAGGAAIIAAIIFILIKRKKH